MSLPIELDTSMTDLFAAYPALEAPVLEAIPSLARLENPVLRETVLKSASVLTVARLAGVSGQDLLAALRRLAGQKSEASCGGGCAHDYGLARVGTGPEPEWARSYPVKHSIDADAMLSTGVHPIGKVRECAATLAPGEMVTMTVAFRPEPLLENLRQAGFEVWCGQREPGRYTACFARL